MGEVLFQTLICLKSFLQRTEDAKKKLTSSRMHFSKVLLGVPVHPIQISFLV